MIGWLLGLVLLTGCAANSSDRLDAQAAADRFHRLADAGQARQACELLSQRAREDVQGPEEQPCPDGLRALDIPSAGRVQGGEVYGRAAIVRFEADTVFLTRSQQGWQVTAAGCRPRSSAEPYDCLVQAS